MNQIEAAVAEYSKTILDLQTRIANAAAQICGLTSQCDELKSKYEATAKELSKLKGEPQAEQAPPDLKVVKDSA